MSEHPLDRPVWASLSSTHQKYSAGSKRARRFLSEVAPFGAILDESKQSISELADLLECSGSLAVAQAPTFPCPQNGRVKAQLPSIQMVYEGPEFASFEHPKIEALKPCEAPMMISLAKLTDPGPFERRTHELGQFWGIKHDDRLVAMAGERLKTPGFVEISGVCTDPKFEGRGYGRALCIQLCSTIRSHGCQPFLHEFEDNARAIKLYESLGFVPRAKILVTVLEHQVRCSEIQK